jgi:pimeloyl-ACP methyl ester carboxylesterase
MAADVAAIVADLELAPAIIGGGSMGAAVALAYALERPQDFRALVLCAPALAHEQHPAAGDFAALADRIDAVGLERAAAETRESLIGGGVSPEEAEAAVAPWFDHDERSLALGMRSVLRWNPIASLDDLERLALPTAIVAHPYDVWHPLELAQAFHERIPHSELTVLPTLADAWGPGRMGTAIVETLERLGVRVA